MLPISFLPDDEHHTANMALMCLINIMGNQEGAKGEDSPIMVMRPDVVDAALAASPAGLPAYYLSPRGRTIDQALVRDLAGMFLQQINAQC